jgi:hypothetical protein
MVFYSQNPLMSQNIHPKSEHQYEISNENLKLYEQDPDNFLAMAMTVAETWVHHWNPLTKQEIEWWKHKRSTTPHKLYVQKSG